MPIIIESQLRFTLDQPVDLLLQFEVAHLPEQEVLSSETLLPPDAEVYRIPAGDFIGERIWLRAQGTCEINYRARVDIHRLTPEIAPLAQMAPRDLPGEAVPYLFGSRFCQSEQFTDFEAATFAGTAGGARIEAILGWIADNVTYQLGSSHAATTAIDTFHQAEGVCRDFAHLAITFARASGIPARYASVYAPEVKPQDFHAIAEVFLADPSGLGGCWIAIDPTGMALPEEMAKIGVGRDAADVSFLTAFGPCQFGSNMVKVIRGED